MGNMPGGMPVQQVQQPVPMNVPESSMYSGGNERSGSGGSRGSGGQPKQQAKPTKRGFLSTILEWFQFSRTSEEKKDTMQ